MRSTRQAVRWRAFAAAICASLGLATAAAAQVNAGGVSFSPPPVDTGRANPFATPGRGEDALPIFDWLIYPGGSAGMLVDSNPLQLPNGAETGIGIHLLPSVVARRDDGIHYTSIYGKADARIFLNQGKADQFLADAGVTEIYRPLPDLTVDMQGDFARLQSVFSNPVVSNSLTILNPTGIGVSPTVGSSTYDQLSATASVQKNIADGFVILGGSAVELTYDRTSGGALASPNGTVYTGRGRAGIWLMPDVYGYFEGSLDTRQYGASMLSSSGYRSVGGIGSDQFGLLGGELYAGYEAETYRSAAIGTVGGVLFGGRVRYYPLPELIVGATLNEAIGASLLAAARNPASGTATRVTSLIGQVTYELAREWAASASGGYAHTGYVGNVRSDDALTLGTTLTYSLTPRFGLTFDYQHITLNSNATLQGFSRDVVTIGTTYRY